MLKLKLVDLSQPITEGIPVYPGDPEFDMKRHADFETDGYNVCSLRMGSHTGTHIDAPLHFVRDGKSIDAFPVQDFAFRGTVLDLRDMEPRQPVTVERLRPFQSRLANADLPLLYFGWDRFWQEPEKMMAHPFLTGEAARWLVEQGARGVGTDGMSIDETGGELFPAHDVFMSAGLFIAENLANLGRISADPALVLLLPLRLVGSDASPIRAVAVEGLDL